MQGQRGIIGSLPETLDFDHGSASGNAVMDQQLCWNNLRNPAEERLPNFMLSPVHSNTYVNPGDHERQNLSRWSLGESSSRNARSDRNRDKQKMENGSSSSASIPADTSSRLEERRPEPTHTLSLNSVDVNAHFGHSSNASGFPQNLNLNADFVSQGDDAFQVIGDNNMYKSSGAEYVRAPPVGGPEDFLLPSENGGYFREDDSRPGISLDGRRQSCKRKAVEGHGQSSMNASSSLFQHPEGSAWAGVHPRGVSRSLSISTPPEQVNPRLGLGLRRLGTEGNAEPMASGSSRRNFRLRIHPSQQESVPSSLFSSGTNVRQNNLQSSHHSSRRIPVDQSLEFMSALNADAPVPQAQPAVIPAPSLPQNARAFRWSESSSSRPGSSLGPMDLTEGEEGSSRSSTRHLWEHPMFLPATELRTSARNPTSRNVVGGNMGVPGSVSAAPSRSGSNSGVHLSAPTWAPHQNTSRNSRRLAEYVRRSMFSSAGTEPGAQSGNNPYAEEMVPPSGTSNQAHHRSHPRSTASVDRQGDGVLRIPYPLRSFSASGEGRSRLVSEVCWNTLPPLQIRNVLDIMRRGEGLRIEDVMILDQQLIFGMTDMHDRHRDMRLDVDNMSYEELLALEERIGNVNTGLNEETIVNRLKQRTYSAAAGTCKVETEPCCVCQEDYSNGERIGTLDCGHDYHMDCIKQWLMLKNWCPICKTTGLASK
ncbi:Probable E3 ubiquitin-protein ligase RHG1A [Linum grandiflorum]